MKIAIVGLGKMGQQIASKLVMAGHTVIGHDQNPDAMAAAVQNGVTAADSKASVLSNFVDEPVIVWLMIPAQFVETELGEWVNNLPAGSTIIDGGNSDYRLTVQRADLAGANNIHYVDVGTSGGVLGLENGFSLMVGGLDDSVSPLAPIFDALTQPNGGWEHLGPSGTGHFVKTVHNAIEYGVMESYAEGYALLQGGPYKGLNLSKIGNVWQKGSVIASELNSLSAQVLTQNPTLDGIEGVVAETGEARWAIEVAHANGLTMPDIEEALKVRLASQQGNINFATKLLAAMRTAFGGHNINGK